MSDVLNVVAVGDFNDELADDALRRGYEHFGTDAVLKADLDFAKSEREQGSVPPEAEASDKRFYAYVVVRKVGEDR